MDETGALKSFFGKCLDLFDDFHDLSCPSDLRPSFPGRTDELTDSAAKFLEGIEYLPRDDRARRAHKSPIDRSTMTNRRALLKLAGRFERAFRLPLRNAPGATFFGAQISHSAFGLERHGANRAGFAGRGVTLRQAFESCAGEAAEYLSFLEWGNEDLVGFTPGEPPGQGTARIPHRREKMARPAHANLQWALAGIGLKENTDPSTLDWIEATAIADGKRMVFPAELCLRWPMAARKGCRAAESNGCAAAPTLEEATCAALEEVIERDAVALWWYGGRPAHRIDEEALNQIGITSLLTHVRGASIRSYWFLDLTTELEIPVFACLSADPDGRHVISGFAAGLNVEKAMIRAALEMCQMELAQELALLKRDQDDEGALSPLDQTWIDRYQRLSVGRYPRLFPDEAPFPVREEISSDMLADMVGRLQRRGFTAVRVDLSRDQIGIPVARVLVPCLQSAKPDWLGHRLVAAARQNGIETDSWGGLPTPI